MEKIKLNETPVRTSRNFKINNIKLENILIPKNIKSFENWEMIVDTSKTDVTEETSKIKLTYGLNEELTNQVIKNSNKKLKLEVLKNSEIQIDFNFDDENDELQEDIEIISSENTKSTVIIKYNSASEINAFHNGIIRVNAKNNSTVNLIVINLLNTNSNNFVSIQNELEEKAKLNYTIVDFGGKNSITNYYSNLLGESSNNKLNTIYIGKENQVFDLNYIAELRGQKTNIDIEVQGALKDKAKKHFKGTIDFKKGCKKATGNENESCMLLSETAKSLALPMLLCSEEDVEGNHSSSAGRIGEKELFYIMSRGFNIKEAMKLMVRAKFNKILKNIPNEELREEILNEVDNRLD